MLLESTACLIFSFTGFIQVHRDNEVDQENEDEPVGMLNKRL